MTKSLKKNFSRDNIIGSFLSFSIKYLYTGNFLIKLLLKCYLKPQENDNFIINSSTSLIKRIKIKEKLIKKDFLVWQNFILKN